MWKDFFYYSKSQRRALVVLTSVLVLGVAVAVYLNVTHVASNIDIATEAEIDSFLAEMSVKEKEYKKAYMKSKSYNYDSTRIKKVYPLRKKEFAKPEYKTVKEAVPYYVKQEKYPQGTIVDINTADTSSLKMIPGVGSGISKMIVAYRNRLGGFYELSQIKEIKYLQHESVDTSFIEWMAVKSDIFRKIKVNSDGIDVLRNHPYMDFYKAKAIIEYRRKRGKIKGLSQISMMEEFSEKDLERLKYYFSFE